MYNNHFEAILKKHAGYLFGKEKELPAGHRERFEQRLNCHVERSRNISTLNNMRFLRFGQNDKRNGRNDTKKDLSSIGVKQRSNPIKAITRKKWLITTIAVAAVFIGFIFLLNPFAAKQQGTTLADVRNYYSMLLEEEALTTLLLIQQVDEVNREILLANVDLIENDPLPEVQITDEDYIILIADFYTTKIESLQNMQDIIMTNTLNNN